MRKTARSRAIRRCLVSLLAICTLFGLLAGSASALPLPVETFDYSPHVAATDAPGVWFTDRYAPAGFAKALFDGDFRLELSISAADSLANRPAAYNTAFYNTQGRGYTIPNSMSAGADVWVGADALAAPHRMGVWAVAVDAGNAPAGYPIIEFANNPLDDPEYTGFRVWDNLGWHPLPAVTVTPDQWYSFRIEQDADSVSYYIDDAVVYDSTFVDDPDMAASVGFNRIMLEAYNFGTDYVAYFDNAMPVPATPAPYSVTTTPGANGSITPANPGLDTGDNVTLTVAANAGYHITDITVDGVVDNSVDGLASTTVSFTNVAEDHSVSANFAANPAAPMAVHRFRNLLTGGHFYTADAAEIAHVRAALSKIFAYEGVAFVVRPTPAPTDIPVFRFYNPKTGTHFYTASGTERDAVLKMSAFSYEGVAYFVSMDPGAGVPVYRFYNARTGAHFYTADATEKDNLVKLGGAFKLEGVAFYLPSDS